MKASSYIRRSLGLMQAAVLLVTALAIGLGLGLWHLRTALDDQRDALAARADDLVGLSRSGATSAAWALDEQLAGRVVAALGEQGDVQAAEIRANVQGQSPRLLARFGRPARDTGAIAGWVSRHYFADVARVTRALHVNQQGTRDNVGELVLEMAPLVAGERFLGLVYSTLAATLFQAVLIGGVLLLIAQWLVTGPLRRAAMRIASIEPGALTTVGGNIAIPERHRDDELGALLAHTNALLDRLVESQSELRKLATRDALTGLPNRSLIQETLRRMLATARRSGSRVAVMFVDLDRFKSVNDSLGHHVGDRLLVQVAAALAEQIREEDAVGRLGGDEFLVVMPVAEAADAVTVVRRIVAALRQPFHVEAQELRTGASIGIALFPDDGDSVDVLMRRADVAMYRAKDETTQPWQLFSEDMSHAIEAGLLLETALAKAVERDELRLHLQPQFEARSMRLAGCEALLRWCHDGEWIMPDRFIGVAESSGLIREIGDWVLEETCRILGRWDGPRVPISVNVSARQLADEDFVQRVLQTVGRFDVPPDLLRVEITESTLMQKLDQTHAQLSELRAHGFRISIDDFGTGYSSLSYLTRLPIDEIKIDRSFVSGARRSKIVLRTMIALARELDFEVVAEGVETDAQRKELIASGCDLLQGYLFSKPAPADEIQARFAGAGAEPVTALPAGVSGIEKSA